MGNLASFSNKWARVLYASASEHPPPPPPPKKWQIVTDHLKIGMLQQQEVRSKAEILLSVK